MREIKFRVWDKLNKNMNCNITRLALPHDESTERLYGTVLQQFTGLKDKNGKEIYEGDIFEDDTEGLEYNFVEWGNGGWTTNTWFGVDEFFKEAPNMEIIGNIYENPELINKRD